MFSEHQPLIARHASTPEGLADVLTFTIATVNQHFYRVGEVVEEIEQDGFEACKYLTPSQKRGIAYTRMHAATLLERLSPHYADASLRVLIEIPNIGIVKAGFIVQMLYGQIGCLDRHNLRTAGLSLQAFARVPQSTESLTQRLETYMATCEALGTPEQLWNGWCSLIATKYPEHFASAEEVSYKHVLWTRSA